MKNHVKVNGKLLQTNKRFSRLKMRQKEEISRWMYDAFKGFYDRNGRYPTKKNEDEIISEVMHHIDEAEIWIPRHEVVKRYHSKIYHLRKIIDKAIAKKKEQNAE